MKNTIQYLLVFMALVLVCILLTMLNLWTIRNWDGFSTSNVILISIIFAQSKDIKKWLYDTL